MRLAAGIGFAVALIWTQQAYTYFQTGNSLRDECLPSLGKPSPRCIAYVVGAVDGMWWGEPNLICLPQGVTQDQLAEVVAKYLEDHPERLHLGAPVLIADALQPAFPCLP
jgi:hypothetical protein